MASIKAKAKLLAAGSLLVSCSSGGPIDEGEFDEGETATAREALSSSSNATLASGDNHVCKILQGGKIVCWGDNRYGQLGNGTTAHQTGAVLVSGITNAMAIAGGAFHTCALCR
jgi:alpha-tubulin suppressor-like RCC1 family protein